ncbi:uncharacterized protein LOC114789626 [Denticeps clupeoides]|uniref:uncharacterized protein LOC114789626 n=1 Tax=Denticeps clupeoides TaxID=299321 RepID=UPI0010A4EA98|nr:uncharacterized protein LOC114789626 [Denticeps clupeoides]XP_028834634.1 uncharacterized protein LOC114789626 [Denticeps clupeoides]XP_028834635.1 uncharacterized protein LOC114789626 [Denticeps clupeoides]
MAETDVLICDAGLMRNVWEIRAREYGQKLQKEDDRLQNSALQKINNEWQDRIGSKYKTIRKSERRSKAPETTDIFGKQQMSVPKSKVFNIDKGRSFLNSQQQKEKDMMTMRNKHSLLSRLGDTQPSMTMWKNSWKISNLSSEDIKVHKDISDWGQDWKLFHFQPFLEEKSWTMDDSVNYTSDHAAKVLLWEKSDRSYDIEHFINLVVPEWEKSWKYRKTIRDEPKQQADTEPLKFEKSSNGETCGTERSASEWMDAWMTTKTLQRAEICSTTNKPQNEININQRTELKAEWNQSWMHFHHVLHPPLQASPGCKWNESWKLSQSNQNKNENLKKSKNAPIIEAQHPSFHPIVVNETPLQKNKNWRSCLCGAYSFLSEWEQSWMITKKLSEKMKDPPECKGNTNKEETSVEKNTQNQNAKHITYRQFRHMARHMDLPNEWNEAWKLSRHQKERKVMGFEYLHLRHVKNRLLADWKESWKCSRAYSYHGRPSLTEWTDSCFSVFKHEPEGECWSKHTDIWTCQENLAKCEEFSLPKRGTLPRLLDISGDREKESRLAWKDSWRSLKHQRKIDVVRLLPLKEPQRQEAPVLEWKNSFRFTNLTLKQDSNMWIQDWSTNAQYVRQERWTVENMFLNEDKTHNGPTGLKGWNESWKCARRQHHVKGELTESCQTEPFSADLLDSWKFSSTDFHHSKPSMTEWTGSWRLSGYPWGNLGQQQRSPFNSMQINFEHKADRFNRFFHPSLFSQDQPLLEWRDSMWTLQRQLKKHLGDKQHTDFQFGKMVSVPDWAKSWKLTHLHLQQKKESWERVWDSYEIEVLVIEMEYPSDFPQSSVAQIAKKWAMSWKSSVPQNHIDKTWGNEKAQIFPSNIIYWPKQNVHDNLKNINMQRFKKEKTSLKLWGTSWKFSKSLDNLESLKIDLDNSILMTSRTNARKHIYSQIDQGKPNEKRWADACKLSKTQPRFTKASSVKSNKTKSSYESFLDWADSWKFSSEHLSKTSGTPTASLTEWMDSWRSLLTPF